MSKRKRKGGVKVKRLPVLTPRRMLYTAEWLWWSGHRERALEIMERIIEEVVIDLPEPLEAV